MKVRDYKFRGVDEDLLTLLEEFNVDISNLDRNNIFETVKTTLNSHKELIKYPSLINIALSYIAIVDKPFDENQIPQRDQLNLKKIACLRSYLHEWLSNLVSDAKAQEKCLYVPKGLAEKMRDQNPNIKFIECEGMNQLYKSLAGINKPFRNDDPETVRKYISENKNCQLILEYFKPVKISSS